MPRALDPAKLSDLGRRLHALCARRGYPTFGAAAAASGVKYSQLLDIAHGRKNPREATLRRIVEQLGGTVAELYAPEPPAKPRRRRTGPA